jgi:uncharacterized membrane protein
MNTDDLALFFGRFHPLVVHLPIGFLIMAFLMWTYQWLRKTNEFRKAIIFCLLLGTLSAAMACVIGYLLSTSGEYEGELLSQHMWAGIVTTLIAGSCCAAFAFDLERKELSKLSAGLLVSMMIGLSATGHIGGSLTHGTDYLTAYSPFGGTNEELFAAPESLQEVVLYSHVVQPILKEKCISCHRTGKLKGGLSLENPAAILKGGESGPIFSASEEDLNELIRRIHLRESDEDVMPPKGKKQLNETERALIAAWIRGGETFDQLLLSYESDTLQLLAGSYLGLVQGSFGDENQATPFTPVDSLTLVNIRNSGVMVRELLSGSFRYEVSIPSSALASHDLEEMLASLNPIKDNISWLSISGLELTDGHIEELPEMHNLVKLGLEQNKLSDNSVILLSKFPKLEILNMYGNALTDACIADFEKMEKLQKVYVWQTGITIKKVGKVEFIG